MDNPYLEALIASWQLALKVIGYAVIVSFLFAIGGGSGWLISALIALCVGLTYGYYVPDREGDKTWWLGVFVSVIIAGIFDIVATVSFGNSGAAGVTATVIVWVIGGSFGGYLAIRERTAQRLTNEQVEQKEMLAEDVRPEISSTTARGNILPALDIIGGLFLILFTPMIMTGQVNAFAAFILWIIFAVGGAWLVFTGVLEIRQSFALEGGEVTEGTVIGSWVESGRDLGHRFFIAYEFAEQKLFEQVDGSTYQELNAGDVVTVRRTTSNSTVARLELA